MTEKDYPVLLETEHYVVLQKPVEVEEKKQEGYALFNRKTGVVEMETTILPRALVTAAQFDATMRKEFWKSYMDFEEEDERGNIIDLDSFPDPDPDEPHH